MLRQRHAILCAVVLSTLALASTAAAEPCTDDAGCDKGQVCESGACRPAATPPRSPVEATPPARRLPLYTTERRLMPELYLGGPVLFAATYAATVAVTADVAVKPDAGRATAYAAIPLVGPWVLLGSNLPVASYSAGLVVSGIAQAGGLAVTIVGLTVRRDVRIPLIATEKVRVSVLPSAGGAVAFGTF
jgi:hypothetical protein